jgi:hypothetical protein
VFNILKNFSVDRGPTQAVTADGFMEATNTGSGNASRQKVGNISSEERRLGGFSESTYAKMTIA